MIALRGCGIWTAIVELYVILLQAATRSCGITMAMESDVSRRAALGVLFAGAASIPGKRAPLPRPTCTRSLRISEQ